MRHAPIGLLVALGLLVAPLVAEAQQAGKVYRIGYLTGSAKVDATRPPEYFSIVLESLRQLGYVEGRNLAVEVWAAEGHDEDLPALAAQLVRAKPDVIVVGFAGMAQIVLEHTKTLPIVTLAAGELVTFGLATSLAKPGGNVTGMQLYAPDLMGKRLQILKEAVPSLRRVAVLRTPISWPTKSIAVYHQATDAGAGKLGIRARYIGFDDPGQLAGLFQEMAQQRDDGLLVWANPFMFRRLDSILELTTRHRLPAMYELGGYARRGGLMSYGPKLDDVIRRATTYVDLILKGAKPSDLPIGQPTTFELIINLKTAKALGLSIPSALLSRADEVIE